MKYPVSSARINQQMKAVDMNATELCIETGISSSMMSLYRSGKTRPSKERAEVIGKALGVSAAWIMGYDTVPDAEITATNIYQLERKRLPLLGAIACGEPRFAEESFEAYVEVGTGVKADFCLRAKGDSMTGARIQDGDIVFVRQCPEVENGRIAVVIVNDDTEATLKRFYLYRDKQLCILKAENPAYKDIILTGEELNSVRVLGEAVAFQSDIK